MSYEIHAEVTRVYDQNSNKYYLIHNKTKIVFNKGDELLGNVIMTNPGRFEFKKQSSWEDFKRGKTEGDIYNGISTQPDLAMRNIVKALEKAYEVKGYEEIKGSINIYNLLNLNCKYSAIIEEEYGKIKEIIDPVNRSILNDDVLYNKEKFLEINRDAKFIMLGFVKDVMNDDKDRIINWVDNNFEDKKVVSLGHDGKPAHPRAWLNGKKHQEKIIEILKEKI